jgi:6-phospho 3-hexuloisomerase
MSGTICGSLLKTLSSQLDGLPEETVAEFTNQLTRARAIFVVGAGRSGLAGRFFAMRLMHLGKSVYVVGDTTTPAICEGDLLVCISGSGRTVGVVHAARTAREMGAAIVAITANRESSLAEMADTILQVDPGMIPPECREIFNGNGSGRPGLTLIPMGTLFELCALMILETIIGRLILECVIPETEMRRRHANME